MLHVKIPSIQDLRVSLSRRHNLESAIPLSLFRMAKKKGKSPAQLGDPSPEVPPVAPKSNETKRSATPTTSSLIICRNKYVALIHA